MFFSMSVVRPDFPGALSLTILFIAFFYFSPDWDFSHMVLHFVSWDAIEN